MVHRISALSLASLRPRAALAAALLASLSVPALAATPAVWGQTMTADPAGCSPTVETLLATAQTRTIDNAKALAATMYKPMPSGGYTKLSCLNDLLDSSTNLLFEPPTLSSIFQQIGAAAGKALCNAASNLISRAEAPVQSAVATVQDLSLPGNVPLEQLGLAGISLNGGAGLSSFQPTSGLFVSVGRNGVTYGTGGSEYPQLDAAYNSLFASPSAATAAK